MVLPTCPSCGQSVLDDDVKECPFCNASMTSSSEPAPQKPKTVVPPSKKKPVDPVKQSAPKPKVSKSSPVESSSRTKPKPKKEDPASNSNRVASTDGVGIPLEKFRSKTNRFAVVCPMCDTKGFAPKSASGREVRCVNSKCLVPLFDAPRLKTEKKEETAEQRSMMPLISGGVVLLAIAGAVVWFLVIKPQGSGSDPIIKKPPVIVDNSTNNDGNVDNDPDKKNPETNDPPAIIFPSFIEIQNEALAKMIPAAQQVSNNRSKPYCRWQTAETYLEAGKYDLARAEIKQLGRVKPSIPFYQLMPLTKLAWKEIENDQDPTATIKQAFALASQFPRPGKEAFEAKVKLASLLIAKNRQADALALIKTEREDQSTGRFTSLLLQTEIEETGDFDAVVSKAPILPLRQPQWSAVAMLLVSHGALEKAINWSIQHPEPVVKAQSLASCFETKAFLTFSKSKSGSKKESITQLLSKKSKVEKLGKETNAYILTRVAMEQFSHGDEAEAVKTLAIAKQYLTKIKIPDALPRPDMKMMYRGRFPAHKQLEILAFAYAEVARLEALLGHPEESWKQLQNGLACTRAMTPSPAVCREIVAKLKQMGSAYFKSKLKELLELKTNDEAGLAFKDYRTHARQLAKKSEARFQLQTTMLIHATSWKGLPLLVLTEIKERQANQDIDQREPYQETRIIDYLRTWFDGIKDKAILEKIKSLPKLDDITKLLTSGSRRIPVPVLLHAYRTRIKEGLLKEAAEVIKPGGTLGRHLSSMTALQSVCQLVKQDKHKEALQLTSAFADPLVREPALRLISMLATSRGKGQPFWEESKHFSFHPTEKISLYHGMVTGIAAGKLTQKKVIPEKATPKQ